MQRLKVEDLQRIKDERKASLALSKNGYRCRIFIHLGTCGTAAGASKILNALEDEIKKNNVKDTILIPVGCAGLCVREPMITVETSGSQPVKYVDLNEEKARKIFKEHVTGGNIPKEMALVSGIEITDIPSLMEETPKSETTVPSIKDVPFFKYQIIRALKNRGIIDPENLEDYIARDGYFAAATALTRMTPEEIIKEVKDSGLRGRGGAGFPTGLKWELCSKVKSDIKYILCNGDEGDPGAFMDRSVMEADPHVVLEGMIIGAKAIGANTGYIYVRAEYPLAVKRLQIAIEKAREAGLLGDDILGTGFNFDIEIYQGAGAFVCGEETALMRSIEGKRGMPRPRPPFPAHKGLWDKPTVLNNVETFANIPLIILHSAKWYRSLGTEKSTGTKVFALTGAINNIGLIEVPMGMPLRTVIYDIGGGIRKGHKFKAVQLGGPSGGCIPESLLDTSVDYESIVATGAIVGSGGMVVMDDSNCMVNVAKFFLEFTTDESCGKCPPCRIGTKVMLDKLVDITEGRGAEGDVELLVDLSNDIIATSLCGLGQTAPNPVLTTIKYFRDEYESHIKEKWCKAGVCRNLVTFYIDEVSCKGCGLCLKACPQNAITGEKKQPHKINQELCIKCRSCYEVCPTKFSAVKIGPAHMLVTSEK
ncbi:MAG: NADH-quinone oxidoreductase subunit NuoF [Nitrospirae bacterium]|nr:NADH-quinone oxidoreductase subunit NuoF [Nitrospirota bacterium]